MRSLKLFAIPFAAVMLLSACSGNAVTQPETTTATTAPAATSENTETTTTEATTTAETTNAAEEPAKIEGAYTITRVTGEPDWSAVPELHLDNILWQPDCGVRASGQLCYDDENLYVHLYATEQDIRAENTEPLSPVYQDSCLEFFFMPEGEDRYFNFEINPNGCLYIGFGHGRNDSTTLYRCDAETFFDIRPGRTDDGWEVFYKVPLSFVNTFCPDAKFAGTLRANLYKCGDKTANKHYLAWNYVNSEKPDYHRPQDFGTMIFE